MLLIVFWGIPNNEEDVIFASTVDVINQSS